jgi:predicted dehydrogenase
MVHDLDWLLQTLGRPAERVRVLQVGHNARTLARVSCEILFQGAPGVRVTASRIEKVPRRELILHNNRGTSALMDLNCAPFEAGNDPLTLQARAFLKLLLGLASPIATAAEILPVMELGERIRADCSAAMDDCTWGND